MGAQGEAVLNFGAFPGKTDATVAVTGQGAIVADSLVEAWIRPEATAEHSADEHRVEGLIIHADTIVPSTGFTIYGQTDDKLRRYGNWTIAWVWN